MNNKKNNNQKNNQKINNKNLNNKNLIKNNQKNNLNNENKPNKNLKNQIKNNNIIITNITNKQKTFQKKNNLPPIKSSLLSSTLNNKNNVLNTSKDSTKAEIEFYKTKTNKFEIDCDSEKILDNEFIKNLSQNEKNFFQTKAKEIYDFLESINLIRFIESFIVDGFEGISDLLEIKKDYFEENKNFTPAQQKRILDKVEEYSLIYKNKINSNEISCGTDDLKQSENISNRCWTCFKKLNEINNKNYIEKEYKESLIENKVKFCSKKCLEIFETNIFNFYVYCDECNKKYDKTKKDFVFQKFHFHSKECLNKFLNNNNIENNDYNNNENSYENEIYDPMNDF